MACGTVGKVTIHHIEIGPNASPYYDYTITGVFVAGLHAVKATAVGRRTGRVGGICSGNVVEAQVAAMVAFTCTLSVDGGPDQPAVLLAVLPVGGYRDDPHNGSYAYAGAYA